MSFGWIDSWCESVTKIEYIKTNKNNWCRFTNYKTDNKILFHRFYIEIGFWTENCNRNQSNILRYIIRRSEISQINEHFFCVCVCAFFFEFKFNDFVLTNLIMVLISVEIEEIEFGYSVCDAKIFKKKKINNLFTYKYVYIVMLCEYSQYW